MRTGMREDAGGREPVLSLRVADPGLLPERPAGATVEESWLHLYAGDWDVPPRLVAPQIESRAMPFRGGEYW